MNRHGFYSPDFVRKVSDAVVVSDEALLHAYIHTEYRVFNPEMTLRAGFTHSRLDDSYLGKLSVFCYIGSVIAFGKSKIFF